jgi:hypothetical protein
MHQGQYLLREIAIINILADMGGSALAHLN